eukprot:4285811-Pleurochrysis_carterae.AAC.3
MTAACGSCVGGYAQSSDVKRQDSARARNARGLSIRERTCVCAFVRACKRARLSLPLVPVGGDARLGRRALGRRLLHAPPRLTTLRVLFLDPVLVPAPHEAT